MVLHSESYKRATAFAAITHHMIMGLVSKPYGLYHSYRLTRHKQPLLLNPDFAQHFTSLLPSSTKNDTNTIAVSSELQLVESIRTETGQLNRNNVSRTKAYWDIYKKNPELHWALLAHMVSRNGGWSMTDLKGQWLPQLLTSSIRNCMFELLEACNSLIFGDAYPQLRLYGESKRLGRNLSYLLPHFGVSTFMITLWDQFWADRDSSTLTVALIINEQNFIQSRVVEDVKYRTQVFSSLSFRSQPWLQMNQIVFPMWQDDQASRNSRPLRLVGRVLEDFENLQERIGFGKSLYGLLFGYPSLHTRITDYCEQVEHTGSRSDYWPHRFTPIRKRITSGGLLEAEPAAGHRLCSLWLSPTLADVWPDRPITPASEGDWFQQVEDLTAIPKIKLPFAVEMTHEHLFGQNKLQTAVLLERSFMKGASKRRTGRG